MTQNNFLLMKYGDPIIDARGVHDNQCRLEFMQRL